MGTRSLVAGDRGTPTRGRSALISSSAVGYYGPHGDERLDEDTPPGDDFLAQVCVAWEREADAGARLGCGSCNVRTGVVLDADGGALSKMLLPFKLGGGGPVAGGDQYMPWIHVDDVVGIYLPRSTTPLERPGQRDGARARHQQGVQQGARPRAAPPGRRADPGLRDPAAVRRHGGDRDQGPARDPAPHARSGLLLPAPRSRRGAASSGRLAD